MDAKTIADRRSQQWERLTRTRRAVGEYMRINNVGDHTDRAVIDSHLLDAFLYGRIAGRYGANRT